jgi:hypothetical protein
MSRTGVLSIGAATMLALSAVACGGKIENPDPLPPDSPTPVPVVRPVPPTTPGTPTTPPAPSPASPSEPAPSTPSSPGSSPSQGTSSAPAAGCIRFEACVDGSDFVSVVGGELTITHRNFSLIGEHVQCMGMTSTMAPSVSLYDSNGTFALDGAASPLREPAAVSIATLTTFSIVQGRGSVAASGAAQILIDDDDEGGPSVYVVDLCE